MGPIGAPGQVWNLRGLDEKSRQVVGPFVAETGPRAGRLRS
jgi:hypothetical protein